MDIIDNLWVYLLRVRLVEEVEKLKDRKWWEDGKVGG